MKKVITAFSFLFVLPVSASFAEVRSFSPHTLQSWIPEGTLLRGLVACFEIVLLFGFVISLFLFFDSRRHSRVRDILSGFGCLSAMFLVLDLFFAPAPGIRLLAMASFLVCAIVATLYVSKLPRFEWALIVYALIGLSCALLPYFLPIDPSLLGFCFCLFSLLITLLLLIFLVTRFNYTSMGRFSKVLALSALIPSLLFCISWLFESQYIEVVIVCIATIPFLLSISFLWPRHGRLTEDEVLLSDQVDKVSIALTRFVPKEFLSILEKGSVADLKLGDHIKKDMTIFFSDIRQFTNLSEGLTPEENFKFINSYLARVVPVLSDNGGFVDKYMGDGIMALFPRDGGADAAVRSGIAIQRTLIEYNLHRANCGYRPLSMGIGLHTGTLMLGVVGVEDRMQSTVISDAVNLASRLESITKVFNVSLAISEETFKSLEDPGSYMYRFIGKVRVKGKSEPVSVFEIFDGISEDLIDRKMRANRFFEQGMLAYYQKDFTSALYYFRKVLEIIPEDGASAFYLDNCMAKARA